MDNLKLIILEILNEDPASFMYLMNHDRERIAKNITERLYRIISLK